MAPRGRCPLRCGRASAPRLRNCAPRMNSQRYRSRRTRCSMRTGTTRSASRAPSPAASACSWMPIQLAKPRFAAWYRGIAYVRQEALACERSAVRIKFGPQRRWIFSKHRKGASGAVATAKSHRRPRILAPRSRLQRSCKARSASRVGGAAAAGLWFFWLNASTASRLSSLRKNRQVPLQCGHVLRQPRCSRPITRCVRAASESRARSPIPHRSGW